MNPGQAKDDMLVLLLERQEKYPHLMPLDAHAIAEALGISMTAAATLLGSDLSNAGLVQPVQVGNEPLGWAGYYVLTDQGATAARLLGKSADKS